MGMHILIRMASCTQNYKVIRIIVMTVSIFMMKMKTCFIV